MTCYLHLTRHGDGLSRRFPPTFGTLPFVLSADAGLRVGSTRWFVLLWAIPAMILSLTGVLYWGAAIAWLVVILMI